MERPSRFRYMIIVVPGRRDRAFYKTFLRLAATRLGASIEDLDSGDKAEEKKRLLTRLGIAGLPGSSAIRIEGAHSGLTVVVVPAGGNPVEIAADIVGLQLGLRKPTISFLVVAEDAEDKGFEERLSSLRSSLRSQLLARGLNPRFETIDKGKYYEQLLLSIRNRKIEIILVSQGLEETSRLVTNSKHAIEDYIIYTRIGVIDKLFTKCSILKETVKPGASHKKAAQLAAIASCYPDIETLINRGLSINDFTKLIEVCDAMKKLTDIISAVIRERSESQLETRYPGGGGGPAGI